MRETLVMLKNECFTFLLNFLKNAIMYLEQLEKKDRRKNISSKLA
jgi:hypothetical protein